ncbi:LOW QUALITY PROTEIN: Peroxidase, family 2 [Geosmithia morbida]|uniref:Peroxidase, family 2 n=1 Tax=Geosmithia morbida TaxID=1094350 RepID=A0A9P5CZK4_9HYPO|nr:LOW QUALITY PROTEIN: Peroxidase, family 2 [Geosmithia morbida]KAF4120602.1 LOW QUALITY PROTEIN: Peroxidase, family 2 [Geosmithia morbida]
MAKLLHQDIGAPGKLHENLLHLRNQKRLLFDPLTTPIEGKCAFSASNHFKPNNLSPVTLLLLACWREPMSCISDIFVTVNGSHSFQPPDFENGDQRGPCPGLNALANHGYISRDGIAGQKYNIPTTVAWEEPKTNGTVFGMSIELATVLSVMGTVGVGNPLSLDPGFSIGGKSTKVSNVLGNLLGLLGVPRGLEGSHNWIEGDSSNTRDDLYVTGDASTMNMDLFNEVDALFETTDALTMEDIGDRASRRLQDSISTNPYFYYGPYTGFVARNAGYLFSGRLLSNHSIEYPGGGHLTRDVFRSFWGVVTNSQGELEYKRGWERIPENWYRINIDYSLVELNVDLVIWTLKHPELASIGGNLGKVNTFAGVDIANITSGVLNAASLLEGNNLVCFTLNIVKTFVPNSLSGLFETLEKPLQLINDAVLDPLLDLDCPAFKDLEAGGTDIISGLLEKYPGASKSGYAL